MKMLAFPLTKPHSQILKLFHSDGPSCLVILHVGEKVLTMKALIMGLKTADVDDDELKILLILADSSCFH